MGRCKRCRGHLPGGKIRGAEEAEGRGRPQMGAKDVSLVSAGQEALGVDGGLLFSLGASVFSEYETKSSAVGTGEGRGFEKTREGVKCCGEWEASASVLGYAGLPAGVVPSSVASYSRPDGRRGVLQAHWSMTKKEESWGAPKRVIRVVGRQEGLEEEGRGGGSVEGSG